MAVVGCFTLGVVYHADEAPSVLIVLGMSLTVAIVVMLRATVMVDTLTQAFMWGTSIAFSVFGVTLIVVWVLWALTPALGGYNPWAAEAKAEMVGRGLDELTRFILWCSPLIIAFTCLLVALFAILRGKIHAPRSAGEDATDSVFIARELRLVLACLSLVLLLAWVAAALAAEDMGLSMTVLRLGLAMAVAVVAYVTQVLGYDRIMKAAENNSTVRVITAFMNGDWAKGIFLACAWPLLLLYFPLEIVHQQCRRAFSAVGVEKPSTAGTQWLTDEARKHWDELHGWNKSSVLSKSIWFGVLYFTLQVGVSHGVTVFLAWLSDVIMVLSMTTLFILLFIVGMIMFLLPPVPGLPIYLISGIVIVPRCEQAGMGFISGCAVAITFAFTLKMLAIFLEQKAIGEPFSGSVQVKMMVAVHTPPMKAVKHILSRLGLNTAKVAVLIGGPDWPTSVLTGIYRLDAKEMLLGSTPIIILIAPVVLAGACTFKAAQNAGTTDGELYRSVANVMTMLSSVVLVCFMMVAGYYLDEVQEQYKAQIAQGEWEKDPQEEEVLAALKQYDEQSKVYERVSRWCLAPAWLKVLLVAGSLLVSLMLYIMVGPIMKPFEAFSIAGHIGDLPGGSVWGLIRWSGWVSIICCSVAAWILVAFHFWSARQIAALTQENECDPIIEEARPSAEGVAPAG
eukprot:CAMPEP_0172667638 /NCGR_PEP_ID=MMETSP1074-20121228/8557_1 /TAXON_ID=2916 /ORGANISM="Ceratium fusus, Strain PA161109" /LENGTH=678 /DNA_ID=CAMNT_0013484175 /DNA_START=306 /DNA_END=2342 /DNA_ORIENTATION=-